MDRRADYSDIANLSHFNHPDLNVDESRSANFVARGKKSAADGNGHGTHVAGTIAALDNEIDVVGVAAGAHRNSLPVGVFAPKSSPDPGW